MSMHRRKFLSSAGVLAATTALRLPSWATLFPAPLYPPMDLSCFDKPISGGSPDIRVGYAAITWGGQDRQAIQDIASLGFHGIQLRENCIAEFSSPSELRDVLQKHDLKFVALSSGNIELDSASESQQIAKHVDHAKFVRDVGGLYLQIIDERPKREITPADYKRMGTLLTEVGKRTADLGIMLGYHNHMGALGEKPEGVDQIMAASDPRYVKLELDVAHYFQGGGDPVKAIKQYSDRLLFLHIKDVEELPGVSDPEHSYRFVELGRGKVDLSGVMQALHDVRFRGWAVIELDSVPDKTGTPKDCALINKQYAESKLGLTL